MATTKQVKILARYIHKTNGKPNGRISYLVESSNGKSEYCTTLIDGKASGCSCPSKKPCYHEKQLEAKEAERSEQEQWIAYRREVARKMAAQYMTAETVEQVAEQLVAPAKAIVEMPAQKVVSQAEAEKCIREAERRIEAGKVIDISQKRQMLEAPLNGNRSFKDAIAI